MSGDLKTLAEDVNEIIQVQARLSGKLDTKASLKDETSGEEHPEEPAPPANEAPSPPRTSTPLLRNIMTKLEQMIISDEWNNEKNQNESESKQGAAARSLPSLTELGRSVITCYSLKQYINLLQANQRQAIANYIYENTTNTLTNLFRFPNALAHYGEESSEPIKDGIWWAMRQALKVKYPEFGETGYRAFAAAPPTVYISPLLSPFYEIGSKLTNEFGIPDVIVPEKLQGPLSGIEGRLNYDSLCALLDEDVEKGRRPLLVVAVVGSHFFGQNDLISRLLELRQKHQFWLHVVGQGLATMGTTDPNDNFVKILQQVDSFSMTLGHWIGVPSMPPITFYRAPPSDESKSVIDQIASTKTKLDALPWWFAIQYLSAKKIAETLNHAYKLSVALLTKLSMHPEIEVLGLADSNIPEILKKISKSALLPPTSIVFKYFPKEKRSAEQKSDNLEYWDSLNSWLGQGLIGESRMVGLQFTRFSPAEPGTTALRFSPLETAAFYGTTVDHISELGRSIAETLPILRATVAAHERLQKAVEENSPSLIQIKVAKWAGVGAVSYVPTIVRDTAPENWNDKQKQQVSYLNMELVHSLRNSDNAFSVGESDNEISCVKFGMLAEESDLKDLIKLVLERGQQIEESSQYLESLASLVRHGIEAANEDLRKESEQKLVNEGVMRQLPMVGSLLNWWAPLSTEDVAIKGRAFDLKTGSIHSTDTTYKYKFQLETEKTDDDQEGEQNQQQEEPSTQEGGADTDKVDAID